MDLEKNYQKIYEWTKKQKKCIEKGDIEQLNSLIEKKQEIIDKIDDVSFEEYFNQQDNPQQSFAKIKKMIENIVEQEKKNRKKLQEKKQDLAQKLKEFNFKEKSRKGYLGEKKFEAKFFDKKG
ncbi:MAG: flagellar protein FliT [Bacillota bacterium]